MKLSAYWNRLTKEQKAAATVGAVLLGIAGLYYLKKRGVPLFSPWGKTPPQASAPTAAPALPPRYGTPAAPAAPAAASSSSDTSEPDSPPNNAYTASYGDAPAGGGYYDTQPGD